MVAGRHARCSCSPPTSAPTGPARRPRRRSSEAGAEEQDPKVLRPATFWRRLYLVDAESGATREVQPEGVNVFEFGWAGGKVAAVCTDEPSESAWYDAWIGLIDIEARTVERMHTPEWQLQCPRISPGGRIAWIEGFASDRGVVTGTVNVHGVGPLAPELDITWIEFADEETLWYAGWRGAGSMYGRLGLDGAVEEIAAGECSSARGSSRGSRRTRTARASRRSSSRRTRRPRSSSSTDGEPRELTSLNAELAAQLHTADWRTYAWESFDGLEIDGLLALPRGPRERRAAAASCTSTAARRRRGRGASRRCSCRCSLQDGYAVFLPNPRGSSGRGQEFARANLGDMGGGDFKDILAGIDALVADGIVDDARVAITGGSYGGFMSSWAVTQTDRFAAAIPFAVVTDWTSFHYTTNIGQFDALFLQGDPTDPDGPYPKWSPVFHAQKCKTPTLIIHGEEDLCTPLPQATEFYNALVEAGCEVELVDLSARGPRLDGARAPDRRVEPHARLARAAREGAARERRAAGPHPVLRPLRRAPERRRSGGADSRGVRGADRRRRDRDRRRRRVRRAPRRRPRLREEDARALSGSRGRDAASAPTSVGVAGPYELARTPDGSRGRYRASLLRRRRSQSDPRRRAADRRLRDPARARSTPRARRLPSPAPEPTRRLVRILDDAVGRGGKPRRNAAILQYVRDAAAGAGDAVPASEGSRPVRG